MALPIPIAFDWLIILAIAALMVALILFFTGSSLRLDWLQGLFSWAAGG